jgi:trimeric autotransporter adhesin
MKIKLTLVLGTAWLALSTLNPQLSTAFAQGTAFTYQGRLNEGGSPASGTYDFRFRLASDPLANNYVAGNVLTNGVPVSGGLFTVLLDFGGGVFAGSNLWLEVDVRTNGAGGYTVLNPLQAVTPGPYAIMAGSAGNLLGALPATQLSGAIPSAQLAGTYAGALTFSNAANSFAGNGAGLANVNAATLGGLGAAGFWQTNGNAGANPTNGAFLGTTDNLPFEIRVNGHRVLRLEPDLSGFYPNVLGGSSANAIAAGLTSTTIGGGTGNSILVTGDAILASSSVIGGGAANIIGATPGSGTIALGGCNTIGGGIANNIRTGGDFSTISGGSGNLISTNSDYDTISGGYENAIAAGSFLGVIGGGGNNLIGTNSSNCVIAGGGNNLITNNSSFAVIPGGDSNAATNYAFAAGRRAKAIHQGAFVWADSQNADFAATGSNQFLIRAGGGVGINTANPVADLHVNGPIVIQGPALAPVSTSSSNLLNLLVGGGTSPVATNGSLNGISFYESAVSKAMSLGYDGSGSSTQNALRIYSSSGTALFTFEASGQLGVGTNSPQQALHVVGNILATGTVTGSSDRNLKEDFAPVNAGEVLNRVAALPISRWSYKADAGVTHLGPMAQDFYAAFAVGMDDRHISMVDADGVALAAIQGLNQKLEAENAELKRRLETLEQIVLKLKSN